MFAGGLLFVTMVVVVVRCIEFGRFLNEELPPRYQFVQIGSEFRFDASEVVAVCRGLVVVLLELLDRPV